MLVLTMPANGLSQGIHVVFEEDMRPLSSLSGVGVDTCEYVTTVSPFAILQPTR
jgi:hypothetical protein